MILFKLAAVVALTGILPAYRPYVGTWTCTQPTMGHGWWATLTITPTAEDSLHLVMSRDTPQGPPNGQAHLRYDPSTGYWTLRSPTYPFVKTGREVDGVIHFADPSPRKQRFRFGISDDGQTITMLRYLKNTHILNLKKYVITCTRGEHSP